MFNDLTDGLKDQLNDIKQNQAQLHDELLVSDAKAAELQEGLKENNNQVKTATAKTNKAIEALKKNKDTVFLTCALILLVAGVVFVIV